MTKSKQRSLFLSGAVFAFLLAMVATPGDAYGQLINYPNCQLPQTFVPQTTRYAYYKRHVQVPIQVTKYRTETETSHQQTQVTQYHDETVTETRYRKITKFVPVVETEYRTRQVKKLVPETKTVMQARQRQVTEMVEETGYRDTQVVVPKTIQETTMQDRSRIVQTPVTQRYQQLVPVTTYKPQTTYQSQLVNNPTVVNQLVVQGGQRDRSRLRWLGSTHYTDPLSGRQVYRRRGLYWTRNTTPSGAYVVPTVVPNYQVQQVPQTSLVPTTSYQTQSYDVNTTVNRVVTEKVPVTTQRTVNELVNQRVPYTVRKPVTRTITEEVPIEQTTMREEITEEQYPVQRTVMKKVEEEQPYKVQITRKVPVTKPVTQPKTITRQIPYTETQMVNRIAYFRVTLDPLGRRIAGSEVEVDIYGNPVARTTTVTPSTAYNTSPISGTTSPVSSSTVGGADSVPKLSETGFRKTEPNQNLSQGSTLNPKSEQRSNESSRLESLRPVFSGGSSLLDNSLLDLKPIQSQKKEEQTQAVPPVKT